MAQMTGLSNFFGGCSDGYYEFSFPKNRRTGFPEEQLKHAAGEVVEASVMLNSDNRVRFLDECMDVIECIEGILRTYDEHNPEILADAFKYHIEKNRARGDYGVEV